MVANITIRKLIIYLKQITTKLLRKIEYLYKMRGYLHSLLFTCIQRVKTCSSNRFTCTLSLSVINKKIILLKNKNTSIISTPAGRWSKKARNRLSSTSSDFVSDKSCVGARCWLIEAEWSPVESYPYLLDFIVPQT